jgi:hypothetical protein
MIFGDCPYEDCDGTHALGVPDQTPKFGKEKCEKCGREYWLYYSRFEPTAYTLEQFAQKFRVDEANKTITEI